MLHLGSFLYSALALVALSAGTVTAVPVTKANGQVKPGSYIVVLHDTTSMGSHINWVKSKETKTKSKSNINYQYNVVNGYSAQLTDASLKALTNSPEVAMIIPDTIVNATVIQNDAPWGLARIGTQKQLPVGSLVTKLTYPFPYKTSPSGVDAYVIDTGINTQHVDFGGRARWGKTFGPYASQDGNGHGTHVAGTIAGKRWGVAKSASIYAVKVLSDQGSGWTSDVIAGIDWVVAQSKITRRPSVINLSLGGPTNAAMDQSVANAVIAGVHVVAAAGNNNVDAKDTSPAHVPSVITVGATSITDARWQWNAFQGSNFGGSVDIFAPGEDITSAWIGSTTATNRITGTSMATPHVSGLVAYLLALEGQKTPSAMLTRIKQLAPDGILKGIPLGTRNEMIWNGGA